MARVVLTPTEVNNLGVVPPTPANSDATNFQQVANDGCIDVTVKNADASTRNVKFYQTQLGGIDAAATPTVSYAIAAGVTKSFYGFSTNVYGTTLLIDTDNVLLQLAVEHKVAPNR